MATVTLTTDQTCDVLLTSNAGPRLSLGYAEDGNLHPLHAFTRATQATVHNIEGRDAPIGFRTTEGRADIQTRTLHIAMDTSPTSPLIAIATDRQPFDALLALIENPQIPYVTMLDGKARRWFTFPEIVSMPFDPIAHVSKAEIRFTECSTDPVVLTVATPPVLP